jgi:hypothetical protein
MTAQRADWYRNFQDSSPRRRTAVSLGRYVLEPEFNWASGFAFESEIEFESGGTGATLEYDRLEESGEFETEVETGGEVKLEKLELRWLVSDSIRLRAGLITVPVGWISQRPHPSETVGPLPDLGEARLLPVTWRDPGLALTQRSEALSWSVGIYSGLNSELIRKSHFIKLAQARQFEGLSADELAVAGRFDWTLYRSESLSGLLGLSAYWGGTTETRNKVDKLKDPADVTVWTVHSLSEWRLPSLLRTLRLRAQWLNGALANSKSVTQANSTLSGPMSPGQQLTLGAKVEARLLEIAAELTAGMWFAARYDSVDSMVQTEDGIDRDPRVREAAWSLALQKSFETGALVKFEISRVENGLPSLPVDTRFAAALAWDFELEFKPNDPGARAPEMSPP